MQFPSAGPGRLGTSAPSLAHQPDKDKEKPPSLPGQLPGSVKVPEKARGPTPGQWAPFHLRHVSETCPSWSPHLGERHLSSPAPLTHSPSPRNPSPVCLWNLSHAPPVHITTVLSRSHCHPSPGQLQQPFLAAGISSHSSTSLSQPSREMSQNHKSHFIPPFRRIS